MRCYLGSVISYVTIAIALLSAWCRCAPVCPSTATAGTILPHPGDCKQFVVCLGGDAEVTLACPATLVFDRSKNWCNHVYHISVYDECHPLNKLLAAARTTPTSTLTATSPATSQSGSATTTALPTAPATCDPSICQLPDCFCFGSQHPGNLNITQVPQLIALTFDDSVRLQEFDHIYSRLFDGTVRNPDGCGIRATFYVSHIYTDYFILNSLYDSGHEIGTHSFTHRTPLTYYKEANYSEWVQEMADMRETFDTLGLVDPQDVVGSRAPYLQTSGNDYFTMLRDHNFTYDTSIGFSHVTPREGPLWPFTLDYRIPDYYRVSACSIPPCPDVSLPGLWEIPLQARTDVYGGRCLLLDGCAVPETKEAMKSFLYDIFERHYETNRSPIVLPVHASIWFKGSEQVEGVREFLTEVLSRGDVYAVTMSDVIRWMQRPLPVEELPAAGTLARVCGGVHPGCERWRSCSYQVPGAGTPGPGPSYLHTSAVYTRTCASTCPRTYPLPGNPRGL